MTTPITPTLSCWGHIKRSSDQVTRPPPPVSAERDIELLFDRSGSMASLGSAPVESVKQFVEEQKEVASQLGGNTRITITTFDDRAETIPGFDGELITEVPEIDEMALYPRGCTRLVDTAVERLTAQSQRCQRLENSREMSRLGIKVIRVFALLTDGMDNMSSQYAARDLHRLITGVQERGGTCIFLAASQDAIVTGTQYGFAPATSLSFGANSDQTKEAMTALCGATFRAFSQEPAGFTQLERQRSAPGTYPGYRDQSQIATQPASPPFPPPPHHPKLTRAVAAPPTGQ